jgi:hypothetical protein
LTKIDAISVEGNCREGLGGIRFVPDLLFLRIKANAVLLPQRLLFASIARTFIYLLDSSGKYQKIARDE